MSNLNSELLCEVTGKPHVWMEWNPIYEGYRRRCALLGCIAQQEIKWDEIEGVEVVDLGIFIPERRGYELGSKGCAHHIWEPWYPNHGHGGYERKCYYCNWWQVAKDLKRKSSGAQ